MEITLIPFLILTLLIFFHRSSPPLLLPQSSTSSDKSSRLVLSDSHTYDSMDGQTRLTPGLPHSSPIFPFGNSVIWAYLLCGFNRLCLPRYKLHRWMSFSCCALNLDSTLSEDPLRVHGSRLS